MNKKRRISIPVNVAGIGIGGVNPIRIQSMTNTDTADIPSTVEQITQLADAGSELVRITVNTREAAAAVPHIKERLLENEIFVPLIGDFHYHGHIFLREFPACAQALDKYRINPGNVGFGKTHDVNFESIIKIALGNDKPVRIGVNWGSLDNNLKMRLMDENAKSTSPKSDREIVLEATVQSALESARMAEGFGLAHDKIILSVKLSSVPDVVAANKMLSKRCDYPLHIGLTEAGMGIAGIVKSTSALTVLLTEGIGDTIRVSLTPAPDEERTKEVNICQQVLQSLGIRSFVPSISACPGCGRTSDVFYREMAQKIDLYITKHMPRWKKDYPGFDPEKLNVATMGCIVNGPQESKYANIGISLPGTGENPKAPVYIDGSLFTTLGGTDIVRDFLEILENYVREKFS